MASQHPHVSTKTLAITVSGGTGTTDFYIIGKLSTIAFQVPTNAAYDYEIVDDQGYGVDGAAGLSGNTTVVTNRLCYETHTFTIANATIDGTYNVRMIFECGI